MAKASPNTGSVPTLPRAPSSDFDKFVSDNMGRAVIGTAGEGDTINPLTPGSLPPAPSGPPVNLPSGLSPEAIGQIEAVIALRTQQALASAAPPQQGQPPAQRPPAIPQQPFATDRGTPRAWNPMDQIAPTTPMSVLEENMQRNMNLPGAAQSGFGAVTSDLHPLAGTPQVYVEAYHLLLALVAGNWIRPGGRSGDVNGLLPRLKTEIEEAPNAPLRTPVALDAKA